MTKIEPVEKPEETEDTKDTKKIVSFSKTPEQFKLYAKRGIEKQIRAGNMTERDSELIREFVKTVRIENNISPSREYKITNALSNVSRFFSCQYEDAKLLDIYTAVDLIKEADKVQSKNTKGGKLSSDSQKDYITFLKRFYLWMIDEGYISLKKEKIQKIKTPKAKKMSKTAADMLTDDDILQLIVKGCTGCTQTRDRALVSVLYEGAFRIHELAGLTWGQISFENKNFLQVNTDGKTKIPRYIPLTVSKEYLSKWKSEYPAEPADDAPVFVSNRGKSFTYPYLKKHLNDIADRAGIKRFNPHVLRHSRITNLAKAGYSETTIKMMCWGSLDTGMFARYAHLTGVDINREIALKNGFALDEDEPGKGAFKNKTCPRCNSLNPPTVRFCGVCGCALDKETVLEVEDMKKEVHADPRYLKMIDELTKKVEALEALF